MGYLSPGGVSFLKAPVLPTKPLRTSSALVGKAYQANQAGLLKEMDEGEDIRNDDIAELCKATYLLLRPQRRPPEQLCGLWQP